MILRLIATGRFISTDPLSGSLANPQTQNPYLYALNNPVNLRDPSGKGPELLLLADPYVLAGACIAGAYLYATNPIVRNSVNQAVSTLYEGAKDAVSGETNRNPAQDKKLTSGEIDKLQNGGENIEEIKGDKNAGERDLFKDPKTGEIYVKPKSGAGPGDPTGLNIRDY